MSPSRSRAPSPFDALLEAYSASARVNQFLVERLHPDLWRAKPPVAKGRTIAALVAHLFNCGLVYLRRGDPEGRDAPDLDRFRVTQAQAVRALGTKRQLVLRVASQAFADGRRIGGSRFDAASFLAYYMAHDAHHRGQIQMQARLLGHPVSQATMIGMWLWPARARE
jgi:uncharacterized damage-inducible protein DinB